MAFVHLQCLIRWLQECGRNECELCRHKFNIKREKKFDFIPLKRFDLNIYIIKKLTDSDQCRH